MNTATKGDIILFKIDGAIKEITFSHWVKSHGNSTKFFDTNGNIFDTKKSL